MSARSSLDAAVALEMAGGFATETPECLSLEAILRIIDLIPSLQLLFHGPRFVQVCQCSLFAQRRKLSPSAVQCSAVQSSAVQCNAIHFFFAGPE